MDNFAVPPFFIFCTALIALIPDIIPIITHSPFRFYIVKSSFVATSNFPAKNMGSRMSSLIIGHLKLFDDFIFPIGDATLRHLKRDTASQSLQRCLARAKSIQHNFIDSKKLFFRKRSGVYCTEVIQYLQRFGCAHKHACNLFTAQHPCKCHLC